MAMIDGKHQGGSVTRALARHRHGQQQGAKQASDKAAKPEMPSQGGGSQSNHDHGGEDGGHEEMQKVQSEHGPAHAVEVKKEGEHHTVKTTHEDGHEHTSKGHPSVEHVHGHIGAAIGQGGESMPEEMPESGDEGNSVEAMMGA